MVWIYIFSFDWKKREQTKNVGSFNNLDKDGDYNVEDDDEALDQVFGFLFFKGI